MFGFGTKKEDANRAAFRDEFESTTRQLRDASHHVQAAVGHAINLSNSLFLRSFGSVQAFLRLPMDARHDYIAKLTDMEDRLRTDGDLANSMGIALFKMWVGAVTAGDDVLVAQFARELSHFSKQGEVIGMASGPLARGSRPQHPDDTEHGNARDRLVFPNGEKDVARDCNRVNELAAGRVPVDKIRDFVGDCKLLFFVFDADLSEKRAIDNFIRLSGGAVNERQAHDIYSYLEGEAHKYDGPARRQTGREPANLMMEIRADIAGDAWLDVSFHKRVIARLKPLLRDPPVNQQTDAILASVQGLIERIQTAVRGVTFTTPDGKRLATQYVKDLDRVHEALAARVTDRLLKAGFLKLETGSASLN